VRDGIEFRHERGYPLTDVVAQRANLVNRSAFGVRQIPIDVALTGNVRARVTASHRDNNVCLFCQLLRQHGSLLIGYVDPDCAHDGDNLGMHFIRGLAAEAGVDNVEFVKGYIEDMPLDDESVDVVISNCVINLSGDKSKVIAEAARVLRPGGRFAVSDVLADDDMDEQTRRDMEAWTGCIAGALTRSEFAAALSAAGFAGIEINETHRIHEHAGSAIIRARKPLP
jgi:SAM-dependent methyltransferase